MINFPLNINHGVALFSIALTLWGRHEEVLFLFRFILWLQPKFFPNVPVFWHQFSRLWSQPEYWCFSIVTIRILQKSGMSDVYLSQMHSFGHSHKMKVSQIWKCIEINFSFQRSMTGFRQASEQEQLQEPIPLWVFEHPWHWYGQHLSLCPV